MSIKPKDENHIDARSIDQKLIEPAHEAKPVAAPAQPAQHAPQVDMGMRAGTGGRAAPAPVIHAAVSDQQPGQIVADVQAQIAALQVKLAELTGGAPHAPHIQAAAVAPGAAHKPLTHAPYVSKSKGYPVQPGQTWHDLTPAQRNEWFANHENRWKQRFQAQNSAVQGVATWSRG